MATLGTLVTRLQDHFSTGSGSAARHLRQLNEWHRRILASPGCEHFRRSTIDITVAASEALTRVPATFTRIERCVNTTTNVPLREQSIGWYRSLPPNTYSSGSPFAFVPYGVSPVTAQPVAAGTTTYAVSSSASDTARTLTLRVRLATGQEKIATATLNGLTAVQVGTWTNAVEILQAYLDAAAVGNVLISDVAIGTVPYGYIYSGDVESTRLTIMLVPTPSASLTLRIDGIRAIDTDLLTTEASWLGADWDWLLELGARTLEYEKQDDARARQARQEFELELKRFHFITGIGPSAASIPGVTQVDAGSNLGPWFPKGRW